MAGQPNQFNPGMMSAEAQMADELNEPPLLEGMLFKIL